MKLRFGFGFTLVDLLLVMGLFVILASISSVSVLNIQNKPSLDAVVQKLAADLKGTQNQSMVGDSGSATITTQWGVYIEQNKYTLFRGSSYSPTNPSNFAVNLDSNINLSSTFGGSEIIFERRGGEISNFVDGLNTITVNNTSSGQSKTITLNMYGVINVN